MKLSELTSVKLEAGVVDPDIRNLTADSRVVSPFAGS